MGHAAIPLIGRKARKPLVGMEPLRSREQRRPYLEGQAAVRARWMVTICLRRPNRGWAAVEQAWSAVAAGTGFSFFWSVLAPTAMRGVR
jgi:hypothetical protein